jgi:crotonobetaine/carnitine-CoA ligase
MTPPCRPGLTLQRFADRTVPDLLDRSRQFGEGRPILITTAPESTLNYGEFLERVAGSACYLAARWQPGTRVACLLGNGMPYFILRYALSCAGLVEVAVNGAHKGAVLLAMLAKAQPAAIIVADRFRDHLLGCGYDLASAEVIDERTLERIVATRIAWDNRPHVAPGPRDACRILYSSGTTGASKAVELSHAYEVYTGERHLGLIDISMSDRWLYVTPMFHIDAIYIFSILLHTGAALALAPDFSASRFWQDAERSQANLLCYVGAILAILLKGEGPGRRTTLRLAIGGGAAPQQIALFERRFGIDVIESYAMTECIACTFSPLAHRRAGSVGQAVPGYDVAVLDEKGARLPPGAIGEIAVRAEEDCALFTRYVGDPEATEHAMRGGWFHTGDLGTVDSDGYLYYRARMKDAIRVGGENVSAQELEAIADSHPAVAASAAIAVPAELGEDDILLYVEPKEGAEISGEQLFAFLAARAAKFMVPRYIRFMERLPRTATQKVQKSRLTPAIGPGTVKRPRPM